MQHVCLQVRSIYAAKAAADQAWRLQQLAAAMDQLQASQEIATRRQAAWYFPVERVAGWRTNPTVYTYALLHLHELIGLD